MTSLAPGHRHSKMRHAVTAAAVTALARWTPYLESEMCGLRTLVQPGSTCIDVGAAAGLYTSVLSWLAGPAGQVHSIEPLPFAHPFWARAINARRASNVRHHTVALGMEAGTETMSVPFGRFGLVTGRSFLARRADGPDPNAEFDGQVTVGVPVDTLDGLCEREEISRIDFIKIDAEGAELQILQGGKRVIGTHRPAMLLEIEERHTARYRYSPDDITGWLFERGYVMHTWQRGWSKADRIDPRIRNYLFCPPDRGEPGPKADLRKPHVV